MRFQRALQLALVVALLTGVVFIATPNEVSAECGVYHTVQAGQNLFRISLRYGVSMSTIAAANGIRNFNLIYVGQRIYIPCAGATTGGTVPVVVVSAVPYPPTGQTVATPQASGLDCTGFVGTSPDAFVQGTSVFYWNAPKYFQPARYQVRIVNDQGANVGSFETLAPNTSLTADTSVGGIGQGVKFYWHVVAVTADSRICQTPTRFAQREWPKGDPTVTPTP